MRRFLLLSAALVMAIAVLTACNSKDKRSGASNGSNQASASVPNVGIDGVRRITTVELRDALAQGTAIVVDTRPVESYKQNHIKGSISMPLDQVPNHMNELPRDKMIVTYCS